MSLAAFSDTEREYPVLEVYRNGHNIIEITQPDFDGFCRVALNGYLVPNWKLLLSKDSAVVSYFIHVDDRCGYSVDSLTELFKYLPMIFNSMAIAAGYFRLGNNPRNLRGETFTKRYMNSVYWSAAEIQQRKANDTSNLLDDAGEYYSDGDYASN